MQFILVKKIYEWQVFYYYSIFSQIAPMTRVLGDKISYLARKLPLSQSDQKLLRLWAQTSGQVVLKKIICKYWACSENSKTLEDLWKRMPKQVKAVIKAQRRKTHY